jgi:triosephosphate isomerase
MQPPIIIVNVKTYQEGTGQAAVKLAKIMEKVHINTGANLAVAVQPTDIYRVAQAVGIPVLGQHLDSITYGSHTGWILPESVKEAGAAGVLLNHSEHPLNIINIAAVIERVRLMNMETVVCANNIAVTAAVAALRPHMVAIEPPDLIGGDVSVTTAEPHIVKDAVTAVKSISPKTALLCGAGIKTGNDVSAALNLGAVGVLLASGVVKAPHPEKILMEMAEALL